ncbi:MAG: DUF1501 domain-containing protein [Spirochaetes bacterium]|nr:DUF1501 domain-containing protein [Spirochaetota bacterium]
MREPKYTSISRRDMLKLLFSAGAASCLPLKLSAQQPIKAKAKAVIQIWMWGGPTHIDTFDPKPDAGNDITGPLNKAIATNVDGIQVNELLPMLAQRADKYSIIRSMTHGNNGHETAAYMTQSGWMPGGALVHPSAGAIVSLKNGYDAGYKGLIPPYIVLTKPQGRFSESGFLGQRFKPFATGGNPGDPKRFSVEGVVSKDIGPERQQTRRELLGQMDTFAKAMAGNPLISLFDKNANEAWDLILGSAGKVFDLNLEKQDVRDKYGMNVFGQACLAARRLVESGVPYVTINYEGWDTHKQHFQTMRTKLPQFDRGMSALLDDLGERGLLDTTIVWAGGEFGRTPRVQWEAPWNGGRNHFGKVFSHVVAGGGFKGGRVVGSTNATGEDVRDRPVYPWDLIGSMYELLGIDPDGTIQHPQGYAVRVIPGAEEKIPIAGRLKEIM